MNKIKVLEMLYKWVWLNNKQISALTGLKTTVVSRETKSLINEGLILFHQIGQNKYFFVTNKGANQIGKKSRKIKINWNELLHQNLMVTFVNKKGLKINEYELFQDRSTSLFWNEEFKDFLPDLIYWNYDKNNQRVLVEIERSLKSKERIRDKVYKLAPFVMKGDFVEWVTDNEKCFKYLNSYFENFGFKENSKIILINEVI